MGIFTGIQRTTSVALSLLVLTVGAGCRSRATAPTPDASQQPQTPGELSTYRLSGVITDETGAPVSGVTVEACVRYYCAFRTQTNEAGSYEVSFEFMLGVPDLKNVPDRMYVRRDGFDRQTQVLDTGTEVVRNFRLRRARTISPGDSTTISIEDDSSLCLMGPNEFIDWDSRCEILHIEIPIAGTVTVEARGEGGSESAAILAFTPGGTTAQVRKAGSVSMGLEPGKRYDIVIGFPLGKTGRLHVAVASQ